MDDNFNRVISGLKNDFFCQYLIDQYLANGGDINKLDENNKNFLSYAACKNLDLSDTTKYLLKTNIERNFYGIATEENNPILFRLKLLEEMYLSNNTSDIDFNTFKYTLLCLILYDCDINVICVSDWKKNKTGLDILEELSVDNKHVKEILRKVKKNI